MSSDKFSWSPTDIKIKQKKKKVDDDKSTHTKPKATPGKDAKKLS